MKELQEIINNKVQQMVNENVIQEAIEKNIEKAIEEAISNQFKSYGNLTKQIEKGLEEGLQINLKDLPFETYNQQMLVAVKQKVGAMFAHDASAKFMEEMDKVLEPAPKEISINKLVETVAESWKTDDQLDADDLDHEASVEFKEHDYPLSDSYSLKMWKQKECGSSYSSRTNSPDLEVFISSGNIRISHRQSYNPTCFSEHEAFIFKLYAAGTVITGLEEFDSDNCDLTLKECEY